MSTHEQPTPDAIPALLAQLQTDNEALRILLAHQQQAIDLLEQREQQYRSLFEHNVDAVYMVDLEGRFLDTNAACEFITGYSVSELRHLSFLTLISPEDREEITKAFESAKQGVPQDGEVTILHKNGRRVPLHYFKIPIFVSGNIVGVYGISKDVTAHKLWEDQRQQILQEALERADHDPLTGLLNHRAFHKRLDEEVLRALRDSSQFAVVMLDLDNFKFFNDAYGHSAGDEVLRLLARTLRESSRGYDVPARFGGDEFVLLLPATGSSTVAEIEAGLKERLAHLSYRPPNYGSDIPISVSLGVAILPIDATERQTLVDAADMRLAEAKSGKSAEGEAGCMRRSLMESVDGFSMLDALVAAVDNKDRYTRHHSEEVMNYCLMLARQLGFDGDTLRATAISALLHDVGKIGVPNAILRKPGDLTEEEFNAIKLHPTMGAAIVSTVPELTATLEGIRYHHERWDGTGYPEGLQGAETPLMGRLMAVADAYSAMTMDRPYRKSMSQEQALAILAAGAGAQWDPTCVHAFLAVFSAKGVNT